jgi:hypothetical protein
LILHRSLFESDGKTSENKELGEAVFFRRKILRKFLVSGFLRRLVRLVFLEGKS